MTKISEFPLLTTIPTGAYIPIVDPTESDPANQNKRVEASVLTTGGVDNTNFEEYDPLEVYNNIKPDNVSFDGNIYKYINATPMAGAQPDINPTFWQLTSSGEFPHKPNTDTHTNSQTFEVNKVNGGGPGIDDTGASAFIFGGKFGGGKAGIRFTWNEPGGVTEPTFALQYTTEYTGTGSDVWLTFTSAEDLTALQGTVTTNTANIASNTTAIATKADKDLTINTRTANYTLALTDRANMVAMDMATANTLTIPPNSTVAFPIGSQCVVSQDGIGQTTIQGGSGVTIVGYGAKYKLAGQWAAATLIKRATNTWQVIGTTVN